jgi:hypothetical protein
MTRIDINVQAGQCHCGAVRFEATLSDDFHSIRRCTCSYCRMRGAVVVMAEMGGIKFLQGEDALTSYRFHTGSAQHFFCSRCGIYTHHQRRSNQNLYAVNVACLDGVSPTTPVGQRVGQAPSDSSQLTNDRCQPTTATSPGNAMAALTLMSGFGWRNVAGKPRLAASKQRPPGGLS